MVQLVMRKFERPAKLQLKDPPKVPVHIVNGEDGAPHNASREVEGITAIGVQVEAESSHVTIFCHAHCPASLERVAAAR